MITKNNYQGENCMAPTAKQVKIVRTHMPMLYTNQQWHVKKLPRQPTQKYIDSKQISK